MYVASKTERYTTEINLNNPNLWNVDKYLKYIY
jgi:hypothetical protein